MGHTHFFFHLGFFHFQEWWEREFWWEQRWRKNLEGNFDGKPKMVKKLGRKFWWRPQDGEKIWKEILMENPRWKEIVVVAFFKRRKNSVISMKQAFSLRQLSLKLLFPKLTSTISFSKVKTCYLCWEEKQQCFPFCFCFPRVWKKKETSMSDEKDSMRTKSTNHFTWWEGNFSLTRSKTKT